MRPATLIKGDSSTGVFLCFFKNIFFTGHLPVTASLSSGFPPAQKLSALFVNLGTFIIRELRFPSCNALSLIFAIGKNNLNGDFVFLTFPFY